MQAVSNKRLNNKPLDSSMVPAKCGTRLRNEMMREKKNKKVGLGLGFGETHGLCSGGHKYIFVLCPEQGIRCCAVDFRQSSSLFGPPRY